MLVAQKLLAAIRPPVIGGSGSDQKITGFLSFTAMPGTIVPSENVMK